jgi:hypothetical protein
MKVTGYVLIGMVAGCAPEATPMLPMSLGEPAGPVTLIREAKGSGEGGHDLFLPTRPTPLNGNVWVLEPANDRLVRFDSTLSHARTFAREGEGPGEIQFAEDLVIDRDRLIVAETGNARLSIFDTTGAFRATLPTASTPRFAAATPDQLLTTLHSASDYAYAVGEHGRLTTHAAIPDAVRRLAESDPTFFLPAGPYIASSQAGDLFVLDQSVLTISRYDATGTLITTRVLAEPFRSQLLERRVRQRKAWGRRAAAFIDSPAAKRIHLDREGRLLVLFSLPDAWGLLIDTESWTARPLVPPENRRLHDILWSASDATLDGDRLYIVSSSQLYQFAVEAWR